jgi:pimeloyl-ACP methyl ester carboxylesterase
MMERFSIHDERSTDMHLRLATALLAASLIPCATLLAAAAPASASAATPAPSVPRAVVADPPHDAVHPARNRQVLIMSQGDGMNALFMLAAGSGPKPTMLLLHGLPGNEQNLDLAQAARRAGWNVLTLHYRGSWGSPGRFSLGGAEADVAAAMGYLAQPDTVKAFDIDRRRIVIAGHSMGGFFAARYAATHDDVAGAILLDPWNAGATGKRLVAHPEQRQDAIEAMGDDFGTSLAGTDAAALVAEAERHAREWDLLDTAPALAPKPLLIVTAQRGHAAETAPLVDAIRNRPGAQLRAVTLASDHSFADARIALASAVVGWLDTRRAAK